MKDKSLDKEAVKPAKAEATKVTTAKPAAKATTTTTAKPAAKATTTATAKPAAKDAKATATVKPAAKTATTEKEKPAKATKVKTEGGGSSAKEKFVAIVRTDNFKIFGIIGLSLILVLCLCLGLIFGLRSCTGMEFILSKDPVTVNSYAQTTKVGYSSQTVDTVQRYKPVAGVGNEQDAFPIDGTTPDKRYPTYGSTPSGYTGDTNV